MLIPVLLTLTLALVAAQPARVSHAAAVRQEAAAAEKREGDAAFHIYSVKTDATDLKRLYEQEAFFARPSPEGKKIAFTAGRFPESAIYVMNSDGTGLVKLTK
ncbi:MAG TPA: hypothetical protein VKB12_12205 [Pyrinomonadaceae bacterium]|nr:hypothetical protein [Pyrinomonadaceae bacterium]